MKTYCSFDIETTGLHPFKGLEIFAYCIGHMDGRVDVYRLDGKDKKDPRESGRILKAFLNDTSVAKICHNLKFEYTCLKVLGYNIPKDTEWHDTMIMSQILQNNNPHHSLDYLAWQFGRYPTAPDAEIAAMGKEYKGWQNIPVNKMHQYQITDGERTTLLFRTFWPWIEKDHLSDYQVEIQTILNTYEIEARGMMLHEQQTTKLENWLKDEVSQIQDDLYKTIGEYINLNSPQQVSHILFKKLKLPIINISEETGKARTGKDILFELKKLHPHPVIDLIMKQRSYTKGLGTLAGYRKWVIDGIIHPHIKTNWAATGREATDSPNLQNVSKEEVLKNPFPVPARRCFRPRPGYVFILFDYSGIQMRLIVQACQEKELMELARIGGDLHAPAAEMFFGKRYTEEKDKAKKKALRSASKNGQFAIGFGADYETLALTLMLPLDEAIKALDRYTERFPKVANFATDTSNEIRLKGYIVNSFNRKLYINRDMAYMGANYWIQSDEAAIMKRGQNNIFKNIKYQGLHMILPVHDELIFEVSRDLLPRRDQICREIAKEMTTMPEIKVRLDIETKMSTTVWSEAKEFKFDGK